MKQYLLILFWSLFSITSYSQSRTVVLDWNTDMEHIYLNGTVTVSGDHSVVYLSKDVCQLRQVKNAPFTFYSEICCSYSFQDYSKGRGKILNVSNKNAKVKVSCIDGEGLAKNVLIIDVKPKTYSHIMFESNGETIAICRKIKCELIKLY